MNPSSNILHASTHTGLALLLSAASLACGTASADTSSVAPSTAEATVEQAPAPRESVTVQLREGEHRKLSAFVGEWSGTGSLQMGETTAPVTSKYACEVAPGGVAVACTHEAQIEGMGPLTENALIGLDPHSGALHWYNINTMGETHDHLGKWANPQRVEWSFEGEAEGQPLVESISMDLSEQTLSFRSETKIGGQTVSLLEGTMQRVE